MISDFFVHLFEDLELAPNTIVGYRTMLAQTFKFFDNIDLDIISNVNISALVQNFKVECPASRFRTPSWDLALVLRSLIQPPFEPIVSINFKLLTYKTIFLTTLASAARASEIHSLSFEGFSRTRNWSTVWLAPSEDFLAKNQQSRDPSERRHFKIPALTDFAGDSPDRFLCPVRALRIYLAKSHKFRKGKRLLFISVNKNYTRDISKNTVVSYLRNTILQAYQNATDQDIKLTKCSVHEVRALSSSVAFKYNVSLQTLMSNCTWRSEGVFTNYYLRDLSLQSESLYKLPAFVCSGQKLKNKKRRV